MLAGACERKKRKGSGHVLPAVALTAGRERVLFGCVLFIYHCVPHTGSTALRQVGIVPLLAGCRRQEGRRELELEQEQAGSAAC